MGILKPPPPTPALYLTSSELLGEINGVSMRHDSGASTLNFGTCSAGRRVLAEGDLTGGKLKEPARELGLWPPVWDAVLVVGNGMRVEDSLTDGPEGESTAGASALGEAGAGGLGLRASGGVAATVGVRLESNATTANEDFLEELERRSSCCG